jgi:hypothetical protein
MIWKRQQRSGSPMFDYCGGYLYFECIFKSTLRTKFHCRTPLPPSPMLPSTNIRSTQYFFNLYIHMFTCLFNIISRLKADHSSKFTAQDYLHSRATYFENTGYEYS